MNWIIFWRKASHSFDNARKCIYLCPPVSMHLDWSTSAFSDLVLFLQVPEEEPTVAHMGQALGAVCLRVVWTDMAEVLIRLVCVVYTCVCVCEREKGGRLCVCVWGGGGVRFMAVPVCVHVFVFERDTVLLCVCECE